MPSLRLFLLGPPRFERDGVPLEFDTHKNIALIAYLAVTGQSHSRETLLALLWPELEPSHARGGLRRNLSTLRKALAGQWLEVDRETVGTDPDAGLWLDVARFRSLLGVWRGHGHRETETCPECLSALGEAVGLYRGDFLEGFSLRDSAAFDEWQSFQTEGLRQELAGALERLVCAHGSGGEAEQAIPYARRWVALNPLHEPAQRWLMRLYAEAGQRAAALRQYQECTHILQAEMGLPPCEETASLYEQICAGQVGRQESPIPRPQHNLPTQTTRFIGRQELLAEVKGCLQSADCRLLTLVGAGGSGKTRLALEAGAALLDEFEHGVFLVSLAALQSPEEIAPTVARAIGFSFYGMGGAEQQLLDYLRRKQMLLILDSFEHLLTCPEPSRGDGVGLVSAILDAACGMKVLATSRARLNLQSEQLLPVAGMSVADEAVELFVASARRVRPDFSLAADNMADVLRVCRLVEGMPLGILLAAAWVSLLSPAAIAAQIGHSLDFLEADLRDLPERQRSMRAVLDHSWTLLTLRLRAVMQALSVFRGGFTWPAAQEVAGASLQDLRALVDKSLLQPLPADRFGMHELLRQYAAEKLAGSPEIGEQVRERHCAYYIAALERWAPDLKGARQRAALEEMDVELENVRTAWERAAAHAQTARLAQGVEALGLFYLRRALVQQGDADFHTAAEHLSAAITRSAAPDGDSLRILAKFLAWRSYFESELGADEAPGLIQRSLAILDSPALVGEDTRLERALTLWAKGWIENFSSRDRARQPCRQSLALFREVGERWWTAQTLAELGPLVSYPEARQMHEESLALRRALGDQIGIVDSLWRLSIDMFTLGYPEEAERLARECLALGKESGDPFSLAIGQHCAGEALVRLGRFAEGCILLQKSLAGYADLGTMFYTNLAGALVSEAKAHLGRYTETQAQSQATLSRWCGGIWDHAFVLYPMALAALGTGDYAEAEQLLQESSALFHEDGSRENLSWMQALLGYAARGLREPVQARRYLRDALQAAVSLEVLTSRLYALPVAALLLADAGQTEHAVELYALASRYGFVANSRWFEDIAGRHIAAAAAELPPEVVAAAQERGRARDLQATVVELLKGLS